MSRIEVCRSYINFSNQQGKINSMVKDEDGAILLEVVVVSFLLFFMIIAGNRLLASYIQNYQQLLSLQQRLIVEQNQR